MHRTGKRKWWQLYKYWFHIEIATTVPKEFIEKVIYNFGHPNTATLHGQCYRWVRDEEDYFYGRGGLCMVSQMVLSVAPYIHACMHGPARGNSTLTDYHVTITL